MIVKVPSLIRLLIIFGSLASVVIAQQKVVIDDKNIEVVNYVDLSYPVMAILARYEGIVVVRVELDEHGKVSDAVVLSGTPLLAGPSVENSRKWEFAPKSGKTAFIVYNFRIDGGCRYRSSHSVALFYPPNFLSITACSSEIRISE